jgi:hypothetical protein
MSRKHAHAPVRLTEIQVHEQVQQAQRQLRAVERMFDQLEQRTGVTLIRRETKAASGEE